VSEATSYDKPEWNKGDKRGDTQTFRTQIGCAFCESSYGKRGEDVFEREDVGVKPSASAGVIAVEVEGNVCGDLREDAKREKAPAGVTPSENEAGEYDKEKRFGIAGVREVLFEAAQRGRSSGVRTVSMTKVVLDKLAMFPDAPDVCPKSVTKTAGRTIGDGVVGGLRRSEPLACRDVLVDGKEEESRDAAEGSFDEETECGAWIRALRRRQDKREAKTEGER
jgi:hypothetical protein